MRESLVLMVLLTGACGGGDDHPDTGYGKNATKPATLNCDDACDRIADCAVALCNEDTNSTRYDALVDQLTGQCLATCDEGQLAAAVSPTQFTCLYADSCREVFGEDSCNIDGRYTCN